MIAIIGATGTLGSELIRQLGPNEKIVAFSRCELKQKELKAKFPHIKSVLGDIRDKDSLRRALKGVQTIFHVAALKHIEVMEENVEECIKTNVLGTLNVCDVAEELGVKRVIFSSTDKAVLPINAYGMAKALSEKIMLSRGHTIYRWGNVLASRGAAIHYFRHSISSDEPVNLTHPEMTRFWIRIEDAVKFILDTYKIGSGVMIPNMKAAPVISVIECMGILLGKAANIKVVGLRAGEKLHESILPDVDSKTSSQYTKEELLELLRPHCK